MLRNIEELEAYISQFTNYERLTNFRYDRETLGLERMVALARELGDPQDAYPSIHVAGTKGKGTTSLILEALLLAHGVRVGTYLSPHVEHLRERLRVQGEPVIDGELVTGLNAMMPYLEAHRSDESFNPSFFELMTALAMATFRQQRVDWAVFEVGLGGRLDATNILRPRVTAITSIGLEHTQQLGGTLGQIAGEKAGIIKEGIPVVLGPLPPEAEAVIRERAERQHARCLSVNPRDIRSTDGRLLTIEGIGTLPAGAIRGPALRTDLAIALSLFREAMAPLGIRLDSPSVTNAVAKLRLPARIEFLDLSPPAVVDGAHTQESVRALREALDEMAFPRPRTLIFSLASGKNRDPILAEVRQLADQIYWTLADTARSLPPEELREHAGCGQVIASPEEALRKALALGQPIVVTGSFYLAGRLRPALRALERPAVQQRAP